MNKLQNLHFSDTNREFTMTLNQRVKEYFRSNEIGRHANGEMVVKTVFMLALYFTPYAFLISGLVSGTFLSVLMTVLMGLGLSGIGLCVMHDGNHSAYSKKAWINSVIGYSLNLVGANSFNWKVQHNVLHHSYTNVYKEDEDISAHIVLRMAPSAPWRWFHRYQFIYAWFLYELMTLSCVFYKDFDQLKRYQRAGFIKSQKAKPWKEWMILISTKLFYISYIFVPPVLLTPWLWWEVLIGMLIIHVITGFLLAIIFQPAHVSIGTEYPVVNENHTLEDNWAIHQLRTTTNFANGSRWFSWLVGGLNFQIEHHLFPNVCHVHYQKIAPIVQSTALEFGFPYKTVSLFSKALAGHLQLLKNTW